MDPRPTPTLSTDLGGTSIAALLWSLRERGVSGTIVVRGECHAGVPAGETTLVIERGALAQVRQPQPLDTLGCLLREQGAITGEQFDESLARLAAREGLQGDILVAMGACGPAAVVRALRAQLGRKAQRLFALEAGRVEFFRGRDLLAGFGGERYAVDVLPVLWQGLRAHPEHGAVRAAVARLGSGAVRVAADADLAGFGFEGAVAARLRAGPATLGALVEAGATTAGARALVALLLATGLGEPTTEAPPRSSSGVQPVVRPRPPEPPRSVSSGHLPAVREPPPRAAVVATAPPGAIPPRPAAMDLRARLAAAEARLAAMRDETYFQMLGLDPAASVDEARAAHRERTAPWRPDAAPPSAIALREVHQQVHALLDEALAALGDEASRRRHVAEIVAGSGTPNVRRGLGPHDDALTKLHAAEVCLRCGALDEAARAARAALMDRADLPGAIVVLVTTLLAKDAPGPTIEALGWVNRGLRVAPDHDQLHVLAGRAHDRRGDRERALEHYLRAYRLNATNMDAVRELRAAARQRGGVATAGSGEAATGLLAKLFRR